MKKTQKPVVISPGKGYRLLKPEEAIQAGDQYWTGGFWFPAVLFGVQVGHVGLYRRKLPKKTAKREFCSSFKKFLKFFDKVSNNGQEIDFYGDLEQFVLDYKNKSLGEFNKTYFNRN